jgi:AcrR family transcriptional regulator
MAKSTRNKLIEAAMEVFAEYGYQDATIQQIVNHAGTNIAAINYHFGDKANFYGEVVSYALSQGEFNQVPAKSDGLSAEQQLRKFVRLFIRHAIGVNHKLSFLDQIQSQEMLNPSPVLDKVVEKFIRPNHMKLRSIVCNLLPSDADELTIRHHCFSVIGQCLHYKFGSAVMTRLYSDIEFTEEYADVLAEHIANVSLAGMRAMHATSK